MSEQENKDVVERLAEQVFNEGDLAEMPDLLSEDFVDHAPMPGAPQDSKAIRASLTWCEPPFLIFLSPSRTS